MGGELVAGATHPRWAALSHLQFRVLTVMAVTALDRPDNGRPAREYWGGYPHLSSCIFGTKDPSHSQRNVLARAIAALVKAGAIERIEAATGHRHGRYRIVLNPFGPVDNSPPGSR